MVTRTDFFTLYCRVCGTNDGICIDLMGPGESYVEKIERLLPIKIDRNDCLPKNLCHICTAILNDFDCLRENCVRVQDTLETLAQSFSTETNSEQCNKIQNLIAENNSSNTCSSPTTVQIEDDEETSTADQYSESDSDSSSSCSTCSGGVVNIEDSRSPKQNNQGSSPTQNPAPKSTDLEGWSVQHIPGKNDPLYICKNCNEILICESATKSHRCKNSVLVTHILPSITNSIDQKENNSDTDDAESKNKKRRRIYFAEDD